MITPQEFTEILKKESQTTLKVMRAFPADKLEFGPHERSSKALKLLKTFVFEMYLNQNGFTGISDPSRFANYNPTSLEQIISDFEKNLDEVLGMIAKSSEEEFAKNIPFAGVEFPLWRYLLMMLFDQVHHRGQLTVYVRLAGGQVPSIYGPSADDSSTNF